MNDPQIVDVYRARLSEKLKTAMKTRDRISTSAIRTALHILDNTGAIPVAAGTTRTEVSRRIPTRDEIEELLHDEVRSMTDAAGEYLRHGEEERAEELVAKADVLKSCISILSDQTSE